MRKTEKKIERKMEVFFDYACPYCLEGHEYLLAVRARHPDVAPDWRPCEAHPRPEPHGPHTDLCARGMFFARDNGVDLWTYHERVYRLALQDRIDIEDIDALAQGLADLLDADALRAALRSGAYADELDRNNHHAYEESGVWAVPAYRMDGKKLDSVEGVGITKQQLDAFMG